MGVRESQGTTRIRLTGARTVPVAPGLPPLLDPPPPGGRRQNPARFVLRVTMTPRGQGGSAVRRRTGDHESSAAFFFGAAFFFAGAFFAAGFLAAGFFFAGAFLPDFAARSAISCTA